MDNVEKLDMYPHNVESAKKIQERYKKGEKVAAILHATGTGKSYNGLYLALEHKEEKVTWIVPTNAIKEHILKTIEKNPKVSKEEDFKNLEIITYQSLVGKRPEEIECDLLILDELHHLGAPIWGQRVEDIKKANEEKNENFKIFGMSAYNVRDRGTAYERDMTNPETEEIFSNSVVSIYDLYDAIIDGVLPKPIVKTVITEDSEIVKEIEALIEELELDVNETEKNFKKILEDAIRTIHNQNGVKELIKESVQPNGKYIYFCPTLSDEGKNDVDTIMETVRGYIEEKYPEEKIVFYKSLSKDGQKGAINRDCFYNDKDLEGNDASDAIRIIFVKNQYNEGVHAPNVDGVFLGRMTHSDIVAYEQIGRALSVNENTYKKIEEYNKYNIETLKEIAQKRGIEIEDNEAKEKIIEKLVAPLIIDLAGNIEFIEELQTNLKERYREVQEQNKTGNKRIIKIFDAEITIDVKNKNMLKVLRNGLMALRGMTGYVFERRLQEIYEEYLSQNKELPGQNAEDRFKDGSRPIGKWLSVNKSKIIEYAKEGSNEKLKEIAKEIVYRKWSSEVDWKEGIVDYDLERKLQEIYEEYLSQNKELPDQRAEDRFKNNGPKIGVWFQSDRSKIIEYAKDGSDEKLKEIAKEIVEKKWRDKAEWLGEYIDPTSIESRLQEIYEEYLSQNKELPGTYGPSAEDQFKDDGPKIGKWFSKNKIKIIEYTKEGNAEKLKEIAKEIVYRKWSSEVDWKEGIVDYDLERKLQEIYEEYLSQNKELPVQGAEDRFKDGSAPIGQWFNTNRSKIIEYAKEGSEEKLKEIAKEIVYRKWSSEVDWKEGIVDYDLERKLQEIYEEYLSQNKELPVQGAEDQFKNNGPKIGQWFNTNRLRIIEYAKDGSDEKLKEIAMRIIIELSKRPKSLYKKALDDFNEDSMFTKVLNDYKNNKEKDDGGKVL